MAGRVLHRCRDPNCRCSTDPSLRVAARALVTKAKGPATRLRGCVRTSAPRSHSWHASSRLDPPSGIDGDTLLPRAGARRHACSCCRTRRDVGPSQVGARFVEMFAGRHYHAVWTMVISVVLVALAALMLLFRFSDPRARHRALRCGQRHRFGRAGHGSRSRCSDPTISHC